MADVFVSYKRSDADKVERLVTGLRNAGLSVWWDHDIPPDAPWEETIACELESAGAAIVIWSPAAVASDNVRAEARKARQDGKLLQAFMAPCEPPLFFGERQGVDLASWRGDEADPRFVAILAGIRAILAGKRPHGAAGYKSRKRSVIWTALIAVTTSIAAILGFIANLGGARDEVCGLSALVASCEAAGLTRVAAPVAEDVAAAEYTRLLSMVPGQWGLTGRPDESSCQRTFRLSVERRNGQDIIALTDGAYVSAGRVTLAAQGVIITRSLPPAEKVGVESTLRPEPDRLTWRYPDSREQAYVRCAD